MRSVRAPTSFVRLLKSSKIVPNGIRTARDLCSETWNMQTLFSCSFTAELLGIYAQKPGTCKPCSVVRFQQSSSGRMLRSGIYGQKPGTYKPCSVVRLQQNSSGFMFRNLEYANPVQSSSGFMLRKVSQNTLHSKAPMPNKLI